MALEALGGLLMFEKGWAPVGLPLLWQISEIFKNKRSSLWLRLEVPVPCMIGPTAFGLLTRQELMVGTCGSANSTRLIAS